MKNRDKDVGENRNFKTYFKFIFLMAICENEAVAQVTLIIGANSTVRGALSAGWGVLLNRLSYPIE